MDLTALVSEPQLIKVEVNDEEVLAKYNEPVTFYMWDRQDLDTFVMMSTLDYSDTPAVAKATSKLILNSKGEPEYTGRRAPPADLLYKIFNAAIAALGKQMVSAVPTTKKTKSSK